MATEKVTPMVLKVDLQCHCCYKKIKKTLCKFPQVRDQVFDEKNNLVHIVVVCCSPDKIADKLCYKAGKVIQSIQIKDPKGADKPKDGQKPPEKPKEAPKPDGPKDASKPEKPKGAPKQPEKPKDGGGAPKVVIEKPKEAEKPKVTFVDKPPEKPKDAAPPADKPKSNGKADGPPPAAAKPKEAAPAPEPAVKPLPAAPAKGPEPVIANGVPSVFPYLGPTYDEYSAGPYYHGYGFPPPPPQPRYEGYYVYGPEPGYGHEYGYGRPVYPNRCDGYFSEENPQGCFIM